MRWHTKVWLRDSRSSKPLPKADLLYPPIHFSVYAIILIICIENLYLSIASALFNIRLHASCMISASHDKGQTYMTSQPRL